MVVRVVLVLLVAALLPPAVVSLCGGSDLDLWTGFRVSWFDPIPFTLGLSTAVIAALLSARDRRLPRWLLAASAVALGVLVLVGWRGAIRTKWLSVTVLWQPAVEATALLALAVATGARPIQPLRRAVLAPLGAAVVGVLVLLGAVAVDQADLVSRISAPRTSQPGRDVVFVLVDTLRAEELGVYGARPSPSPWLDAVATRSAFFQRAFSQASWTYPSVTSFMTSRQPTSLKLHDYLGRRGDSMPALDASVPRLVDDLRQKGWRTTGFYTNPFLGGGSGVEVGFDVYEFVGGPDRDVATGGWVVDAVMRWGRILSRARENGDRSPYFLYLHFMEPHLDYAPPKAFWPREALAYDGPLDGSARTLHKKMRAGTPFTDADLHYLRSLYRAEVAYLDSELRRLEAGLRTLGLWNDDTIFVFAADHGEQIGEHGEFEHGDVHAENVHVPFWIQAPGVEPRSIEDVVRLLDLTPTLLALLGQPPLPGAEGRSLVPLLRGGSLPALPAFTDHGERHRVTTAAFSLLVDHGKLALYDGTSDPRETTSLAGVRVDETNALHALLEEHLKPRPEDVEAAPTRVLDPTTREALRNLGYVD